MWNRSWGICKAPSGLVSCGFEWPYSLCMLYAQGQCNFCHRSFLSRTAGRSHLHGIFQDKGTKNPQGARILHSAIVFTDSRIRRSWYFGMPSISISFVQSPLHLPSCLWLRNGCRFVNIQRDEDTFGCPGGNKLSLGAGCCPTGSWLFLGFTEHAHEFMVSKPASSSESPGDVFPTWAFLEDLFWRLVKIADWQSSRRFFLECIAHKWFWKLWIHPALTSCHGDLSRFHWLQVGNNIYFVPKSSTQASKGQRVSKKICSHHLGRFFPRNLDLSFWSFMVVFTFLVSLWQTGNPLPLVWAGPSVRELNGKQPTLGASALQVLSIFLRELWVNPPKVT